MRSVWLLHPLGCCSVFYEKMGHEHRGQGSWGSAGGLSRVRKPAWGERLLQPGGCIKPWSVFGFEWKLSGKGKQIKLKLCPVRTGCMKSSSLCSHLAQMSTTLASSRQEAWLCICMWHCPSLALVLSLWPWVIWHTAVTHHHITSAGLRGSLAGKTENWEGNPHLCNPRTPLHQQVF